MPGLELRLKAFNEFEELKSKLTRQAVVERITLQYGLSKGTLYQWYKGSTPLGHRAGRVARIPELLYVIGALLGDGCVYHWRGNFQVWLVGERGFVAKFAGKLSACIAREVRFYKYGSKNAWFVRIGNAELYFMIRNIRNDLTCLQELVDEAGRSRGLLEVIEGFFDAEGCVKIIRESSRMTPKICIDFCNTDKALLDAIQGAIHERLGIAARFSTQRAKAPRKAVHHLRIYRKEDVRRFLSAISTTKLVERKKALAEAWFAKKTGRESATSRPSQVLSPHLPS